MAKAGMDRYRYSLTVAEKGAGMVNICTIKRTLFMIPLLYFTGCANIESGGYKLQTMDHIHLNNMQKISSWFIETAIGQYYERKGKEVYKKRPGDPEWLKNYPDVVWIFHYINIRGYSY
ncbi:MAG: hypothetical protein GY928_24410, partial [Colwellia sp.]|nr:hypothetical protein [Colwellia sp.]